MLLRRPACLAALALLVLAGCSPKTIAPAERAPEGATYANPVLARDFPDPTVIAGADGWYYAYATQSTVEGQAVNIQVARSRDLVDWETRGDALPARPRWGDRQPDYWAPHVLYDAAQQTYFMYYSAHHDSLDAKCLAVATAPGPEGPFADSGAPLACGPGFVNIDPMAFDDPATGKKLLYWGSGFEPIRVRELDSSRLHFAPGSQAIPVVYPGLDASYNILVEGAWVVLRDGFYYLFYSGDNCCGPDAHYAVMVARARSATGPFTRLGQANGTGSSAILEAQGRWNAPGHNSVVTDRAGVDWMFYHAIDREKPTLDAATRADRRVMLMDRIEYVDGWPRIAGGHPSTTPRPR